jgi:uncharacterized membrane protein YoaK (UPF0700 family)
VEAPGSPVDGVVPADVGAEEAADALERRHLAVLLVVVVATGIVDAASLLHLDVFTAYITGSFILFGAHLAGIPGSPLPSAAAVGSFVAGALVGARLVHRRVARHRQLGDVLVLVAALVAVAAVVAAVAGIVDAGGRYATTAVLGMAMGCQLAVIRAAGVRDVAMAAGTVVTYSLVAGTRLAGGTRERTARRVAVVVALVVGAAAGAGVARWQPWAAWALAGVVIAGGAATAYVVLPREVEP